MEKYSVFDCSVVELDRHHSDRKGNPNRQRDITPTPRPPPQFDGATHTTPPRPAEGEKQMLNWAYPYQSPLA